MSIHNQPIITRNRLPIPPALETFAARLGRLPWWIIIIGLGLAAAFTAFITNDLYRRALQFVTDNPILTTNEYANVTYQVRDPNSASGARQVRGVLTGQDETTTTVKTHAEVVFKLPATDFTEITCAVGKNEACEIGTTVSVVRIGIGGTLLFEDLGRFQVRTDAGEIIDVRKIGVDVPTQQRTPEGCSASPEGTCRIRLNLKPDEAANILDGVLTERGGDRIVVQTVPPIFETLSKADIQNTIFYEPRQCALNNLSACNEGIFMTVGITLISFAGACFIGLCVGLMRISKNPILYNFSTMYVEVLRGIPMLVILLLVGFAIRPWLRDEYPTVAANFQLLVLGVGALFLAYVVYTRLPFLKVYPGELIRPALTVVVATALGCLFLEWLRTNSNLSTEMGGVLGLSIGFGAFLAELFRAGIQSIGRGQSEAARSLGMNYVQSMRYVILPQAFRVVLPPLGNEFIALLKDSSLIVILAISEMTQKARIFAADTIRPFEAYITIAVLYLIMTVTLSFLVRVLEHRTALPR